MKYAISFSTYESLKECLSEIYPQVEVKLLEKDTALRDLGFVDYIPCIVELVATDEQIEEIIDMGHQYEIDAYNTETGDDPLPGDPNYRLYLKYGWLQGIRDWEKVK